MIFKGTNKNIYSAAKGTVKYKGYSSGNGYHVILQHKMNGKTVYSLYSHLSSYKVCPAVGKAVTAGQMIGIMGTTGNSTGVHLHFGVFTGTYRKDPLGYTKSSSVTKVTKDGTTYYNPIYVVKNNKLP